MSEINLLPIQTNKGFLKPWRNTSSQVCNSKSKKSIASKDQEVERSSTFIQPLTDSPGKQLSFSVVCPVYNESDWIDQLLEFVTTATVQPAEVFLIDGGSTDDTLYKIKNWQARYSHIHLLHNPHRYVPHALNLAIPRCIGDIIVRLDAHTEYAPDYFEKILETFEYTGADIVGGPTRTRWKSAFQHAVGIAICDAFGVGDSKVHKIAYSGESDSVTFGAWKRHIFARTGLFDEDLVRNQDDEFHYRARSMGYKVYQNKDIRLYYYPRNSIKGLFSQYFQYGLYKPLVLKKVGSETKFRHIVPAAFVAYMITLPLLLWIHWYFLIPILIYFFILVFKFFTKAIPFVSRLYLPFVFLAIHLGYGSGFLFGLVKIKTKLFSNG